MHYVILDMEWDSTYHKQHKRFVNQILQIGAVKLDENFNVVDVFDVTVKSLLSKKVSNRFAELTGITTEMMLGGVPLELAVQKYNDWLGSDTVTITWSNSDLYTIAENEKYLLNNIKFKIEKYLDLQSFIQSELRILGFEIKSQISLSHAAELLGITTCDYDLHTAKDDSLLCAALLKKQYDAAAFETFIKDTADPQFYKKLFFKSYYLTDIRDKAIDKSTLVFYCDDCENKLKRVSKWIYRHNWFTANFVCGDCGKKYVCRVSYKKTYDNLIVKRRIAPKDINPENKVNNNVVQPVPSTM